MLLAINENSAGQRLDNYLAKTLKGVPRNYIYRVIRSGEVRVNKKRIAVDYRLLCGDWVRIPPTRVAQTSQTKPIPHWSPDILFDDHDLLVINKPVGVAVHGGSGLKCNIIDMIRVVRSGDKFLELVHRLDRATSGVLILAKRRSALLKLHEQMRNNLMDKRYLIMVQGRWEHTKKRVILPLKTSPSVHGEQRVYVSENVSEATRSETVFRLQEIVHHDLLGDMSLLEGQLITGRMHQLRAQLVHLGFPILGDDKYGNFTLNRQLRKYHLKRMFLHAISTSLHHPSSGEKLSFSAPLPADLKSFYNLSRS
ncbi:MAG: RluA family pseudouridine synthase [Methylophilaceae bacterium]|nr:RluA family pseudouridine synthase [Methylophilaceae bacterium]